MKAKLSLEIGNLIELYFGNWKLNRIVSWKLEIGNYRL